VKSIRDDKQYLEAERILNELSGKRDAIEKELHAINVASHAKRYEADLRDPVEQAMQLEPGIRDIEGQHLNDRVPTLRDQSAQLRKAIGLHVLKTEIIRREAGNRVLANNVDSYLGNATRLLELVDELITVNKALTTDRVELYRLGVQDAPEVQFPSFGLSEQLPYWREGLHEQVQLLNHIARVHG
jgi:hypothetical protein